MRLKYFLFVFILLNGLNACAQKEANVWYFGDWLGLDFNTGEPIVLDGFIGASTSSVMSDPSGNFLFASNAEKIWNRNKEVMYNGTNLISQSGSSQGCLIVQKPGSLNLYYVFTTGWCDGDPANYGLYYSVVDMNLDGGLGGVTSEKNILLNAAWDAAEKIVGCRHENGEDIWVITRKFTEDGYAAFLLTVVGVNPVPVFSTANDMPFKHSQGSMKISYNKKHLVTAYSTELGGYEKPDFEICNFNASTGEIELLYTIRHTLAWPHAEPHGVEFSPDSKYLYLSFYDEKVGNIMKLYQYDVAFIEDSAQFVDSEIHIASGPVCGLQLATDGKIYCTTPKYAAYEYISIIHEPWKRGAACNYEADAIYLDGRRVYQYYSNILLDYLYRFEWEGQCQSSPFEFQSNFQPDPEFIAWDFGDPASGSNNYSNEINPEHLFSAPGEYEVSVYVKYPSGRVEETSRIVTVEDIPHPSLGPGYTICEGDEVTLYAGDEEGMYAWSTGEFGQNLNQITVSDSGWYWVQVTQEVGCFGIDSVKVIWYPKAIINEDGLSLIPTSCGGNNGQILGLTVTGDEPLSFEWYDADSNLLSNALDLSKLGVGNYFLHILDGNGCTTISHPYTIEDAGDIEINAVEKQNTHCGQSLGEISIEANSLATGYLLYSIDNGTSWQADDSLFVNLPAGSYIIRVSDTSGCESVYENNPIVIENIQGPKVTQVNTTDEIDYLENGQIDITANVSSWPVFYSIDNGNTFQTNDGLFTNLSAGTYYCMVKDDFGCDTAFIVEVDRIISQLIEAIAGDGTTCIGNAAVVPLKLNNFTDIFKFHVKLTYDTAILNCDGYINVYPDLETGLQASIIPGTDEIIISWQGEVATSLEEGAVIMELVFGAKEEGFTGIDWAATGGESAFYNENLEQVNATYHLGILTIYKPPKIMMNKEEVVCEGDDVYGFVLISDGSGDIDYVWGGPGGYLSNDQHLQLSNVQSSQAGIYTLSVNDTLNCKDSRDINLIVNQNPQIAFQDKDTIYTEPGFILEAGIGHESYIWSTNETTDAIQIHNEGLYSVFVTSTEQCEASDSVTILWGGEPFWLPNAFSPNGDGLNDEFTPVQRYDYVNSYNLSIYNRWGQLIFETSDIEQGWDGEHKGKTAPQGTYVYRIVYTAHSTGAKTQVKIGTTMLMR